MSHLTFDFADERWIQAGQQSLQAFLHSTAGSSVDGNSRVELKEVKKASFSRRFACPQRPVMEQEEPRKVLIAGSPDNEDAQTDLLETEGGQTQPLTPPLRPQKFLELSQIQAQGEDIPSLQTRSKFGTVAIFLWTRHWAHNGRLCPCRNFGFTSMCLAPWWP